MTAAFWHDVFFFSSSLNKPLADWSKFDFLIRWPIKTPLSCWYIGEGKKKNLNCTQPAGEEYFKAFNGSSYWGTSMYRTCNVQFVSKASVRKGREHSTLDVARACELALQLAVYCQCSNGDNSWFLSLKWSLVSRPWRFTGLSFWFSGFLVPGRQNSDILEKPVDLSVDELAASVAKTVMWRRDVWPASNGAGTGGKRHQSRWSRCILTS